MIQSSNPHDCCPTPLPHRCHAAVSAVVCHDQRGAKPSSKFGQLDYDLRGAHVLPLDAVVGLEVRDETVRLGMSGLLGRWPAVNLRLTHEAGEENRDC
jgi:hypothetical protein